MNRLFALLFCFAAAYLDEIEAVLRTIIKTAKHKYFSRSNCRSIKAERRWRRGFTPRGRPLLLSCLYFWERERRKTMTQKEAHDA
jgi:hypothetical protein